MSALDPHIVNQIRCRAIEICWEGAALGLLLHSSQPYIKIISWLCKCFKLGESSPSNLLIITLPWSQGGFPLCPPSSTTVLRVHSDPPPAECLDASPIRYCFRCGLHLNRFIIRVFGLFFPEITTRDTVPAMAAATRLSEKTIMTVATSRLAVWAQEWRHAGGTNQRQDGDPSESKQVVVQIGSLFTSDRRIQNSSRHLNEWVSFCTEGLYDFARTLKLIN